MSEWNDIGNFQNGKYNPNNNFNFSNSVEEYKEILSKLIHEIFILDSQWVCIIYESVVDEIKKIYLDLVFLCNDNNESELQLIKSQLNFVVNSIKENYTGTENKKFSIESLNFDNFEDFEKFINQPSHECEINVKSCDNSNEYRSILNFFSLKSTIIPSKWLIIIINNGIDLNNMKNTMNLEDIDDVVDIGNSNDKQKFILKTFFASAFNLENKNECIKDIAENSLTIIDKIEIKDEE